MDKTYKFVCRSTRGGFTEYCSVMNDGAEVKRIDRNVQVDTVREFRERCAAELEAEGYKLAEHQYTL